MFDKERFHNQLALNLGYKRIIKDKRYDISVEYQEYDIPIVHIKGPDNIRLEYNPSEEIDIINTSEIDSETMEIIGAIHQAYIQAITKRF